MMTNVLIARIQNIHSAGESYKNANILRDRKKEVENFMPIYNDLCTKFSEVSTSYNNLMSLGLTENIDFSSIRSNILTLKSKVAINDFDRPLISSMKRELDRINSDLLRSWKAYISNKISSIDGVLSSLGNLIVDTPEKESLQQKKCIFSASSIGAANAVKAIEDYIIIYNNLMSKLNLRDEVMDFLKKLTSGSKVTLVDLNPKVFEWIKESGFANKISLVI